MNRKDAIGEALTNSKMLTRRRQRIFGALIDVLFFKNIYDMLERKR